MSVLGAGVRRSGSGCRMNLAAGSDGCALGQLD
jgi:hypothetical protein